MPLLETHNLGRDFPGVRALHDASIKVRAGAVHVLAGENGAGKSTLVKLVTGTDSPTFGSISINGQDTEKHVDLFKLIAYVPQELSLFAHMSVAENLLLPFRGHSAIVSQSALEKEARGYLEKFGIEASPADLVRNISVPDQQLLQIARACTNKDMQVLILDEPTSSLTPIEVARVFKVVRDLKADGIAVVFISHKLDEVFDIGDDYTVLRNGEMIETGRLAETDADGLIRAMSGGDLKERGSEMAPDVSQGEPILRVENLSGPMFHDISFELKPGEILGFAGLVGAGRSEVMQTIFGFRKAISGAVNVHGEDWPLGNTTASVRGGMLYLSEERKHHGIFSHLSLRENVGLSILDLTRSPLGINARAERQQVEQIRADYEIQTDTIEKRISLLSGGNQQKAIIGRAMATRPRILIFDEPTKGIDVRTKSEIYAIMRKLAADGVGIVLVSSEVEELLACSTRIIAMHSGRITGTFSAEDASADRIVSAIFGSEEQND
ncbi:MAG: sugar ABC transporter ATP-binding protein [Pseudomonadota bacterium]